MERFYAERAGRMPANTGAVTVVERTSSDLRVNPHLHVVFLNGAYHEDGAHLAWELGHLETSEIGQVPEADVRRMDRHLRRCGLLELAGDDGEPDPDTRSPRRPCLDQMSQRGA